MGWMFGDESHYGSCNEGGYKSLENESDISEKYTGTTKS